MPRGADTPILLAGTGAAPLAEAIGRELGVAPGAAAVDRFPDGELRVELLADVRDRDVVVVQSLHPPADGRLVELLFLADAARRGGARALTAVLPFLAYARQDRRVTGREALAVRVVAELVEGAGFDRVIALDVHCPSAEGFFHVPFEHLSAIPALADELARGSAPDAVLVSPDLGGAKRAEQYARRLGLPVAIVHKIRAGGASVAARAVAGEVRGRPIVIVDDMISTGATLEAAIRALLAAGCSGEFTVAATHALLVGGAARRLARLPIRRLVTTDSVPPAEEPPVPLTRVGIAPVLAGALARRRPGQG